MATTTTHYGFDIPQSTDLVKDGATAIATLGQDIDTAMNTALGTKKSGLVLLNTTSFSGVASQSVNDVFSATYDNYVIKAKTTGSTNANANLRFRVGGVDASGANYETNYLVANGTSVSGARATTDTSAIDMILSNVSTTNYARVVEILNPFATVPTSWFNAGASDSGGSIAWISYAGRHTLSTSYTGFTIIAQTGTISGSVSVYGYNKQEL